MTLGVLKIEKMPEKKKNVYLCIDESIEMIFLRTCTLFYLNSKLMMIKKHKLKPSEREKSATSFNFSAASKTEEERRLYSSLWSARRRMKNRCE
jgi:hypothetical protein